MHIDTVQELGTWSVAGLLLESFARRDFAAVGAYLDPDVRFRALIPPGLVSETGPAAVVARLAGWFGGDDDFAVIDAAIGQVGTRAHLRWRVRRTPVGGAPLVVEQHLFATTAGGRIAVLDLLCSGFQPETD